MCGPGLTAVLVAAAIFSSGEHALAYRGTSRWDPFHHHHHRLPIDVMMDVVNNLAVDVLQDYAFSRGNFAFSPYGATSVLVALYEGARGESARQIHSALRLPRSHDVVRIGFRDLHRKLRVHFVDEGFLSGLTFSKNKTEFRPEYIRALRFYGYEVEASTPVDAPATSTQTPQVTTDTSTEPERVTTDSFTTSPPTPPFDGEPSTGTTAGQPESTPAASEATTVDGTSESTAAVTEMSTEVPVEVLSSTATVDTTTDTSEVTSGNPQTTTDQLSAGSGASGNVEVTSDYAMAQRTTVVVLPTTLTTENTVIGAEGTTGEVDNINGTETPQATDTTTGSGKENTAVSNETSEGTTISLPSYTRPHTATVEETGNITEQISITPAAEEATSTEGSEILETAAQEIYVPTTIGATREEETISLEPTGSVSSTGAFTADEILEGSSTIAPSTQQASTFDNTAGNTVTTSSGGTVDSTSSGYVVTGSWETTGASVTNTEVSTETSFLATLQANDATGTLSSSANPIDPAAEGGNISAGDENTRLGLVHEEASTPAEATPLRRAKRSFFDGDLSVRLQNGVLVGAGRERSVGVGGEDSSPRAWASFLVDGALLEKVPAATFTASLPFAFVPRLDALALELPLENEWHRLLILLPLERRGLHELIFDLGSYPLAEVTRSLRRTKVEVVIPDIEAEGYVVLTPTLQKLGVWDVFDPQRADLGCMSSDPDLYVRDLEQAVAVDIGSSPRRPHLRDGPKMPRRRAEPFLATHPFLYFVLDRDTRAPLVAGKMVDPLNSRIF